jgi:hypothetical protein
MIKRFVSMIQSAVKAVTSEKVLECAVDDEIVSCDTLSDEETETQDYVGVPSPVYLKDDEWFGPAPEYTDNQKDYMERETEIKRQEFEKSFSIEPENIHQVMYEIATSNWNTVDETKQSMGGSENFQEGWNSGTGMGQYR